LLDQQQPIEESFYQDNTPIKGKVNIIAIALYDYFAEAQGDLSFSSGDVIYVVDQSDPDGWWYGQLENGVVGSFPMNYVEVQSN